MSRAEDNDLVSRRLLCEAVCLGDRFDFKALHEHLMANYRCTLYRDVLGIELQSGHCFVFPYGVIVHWDIPEDLKKRLRNEFLPFVNQSTQPPATEIYSFSEGYSHFRITRDHIEIPSIQPMPMIAISHALAQSIKLGTFEEQALQTIRDTAHIPRALAETGRIELPRRETAKIRGKLFLTKSDIILKYDLLDTPEFFWEYPELDATYQIFANYLEIRSRTNVLSQRLETIRELFEMLADEQKHKHSSTLEWIIIWLIAVEIFIFLFNDFVFARH
ncbi:Conserved hypothetical protein [gamma proteobacterium HdN1]|nr:Conserved hypothetical protein [gamma proteobacterium HdN1]